MKLSKKVFNSHFFDDLMTLFISPRNHQQFQETSNTSASEGSTWRGFWGKVGKLLPYMWPKKAPMLQFQVVLCVLLLVGLRVTNVFVPIYYKNVVDSLGSSPLARPHWLDPLGSTSLARSNYLRFVGSIYLDRSPLCDSHGSV